MTTTIQIIGERYVSLPTLKPLSIPAIKAWREAQHQAHLPCEFADYFISHGICLACRGIGRTSRMDHSNLSYHTNMPCPECGGLTHPLRVLQWQDIRKVAYVRSVAYYCSRECLSHDRNAVDCWPLDRGETAEKCFHCDRVLNVRCPA